jgi:hypothetical protein
MAFALAGDSTTTTFMGIQWLSIRLGGSRNGLP